MNTVTTSPVPAAAADAAILRNVRIAAPCSVSWDAMPGGERVRSCEQCGHKVYNLSALPAAEAAALLQNAEGKRLCVRFYRRADGTVMTRDCPVGLRLVRRRIARAVSCSFASVLLLGGSLTQAGRMRAREQAALLRLDETAWRANQPAPVKTFLERVDPAPMMGAAPYRGEPMPEPTMGKPMVREMGNYTVPTRLRESLLPMAPDSPPQMTERPAGVVVGRIAVDHRPDPFTPLPSDKK